MRTLPRSIAVVDIGSTNLKVVQFGPDLELLNERSTPALRQDAPPYLHLVAEAALGFATAALRDFDRAVPVDAIVPCTHGSSLALLDAAGALALPVMSYLAEVPQDVAEAYAAIAPDFAEVLAPINPGALTLGRQLLWQETQFAEAFARVRQILPYPQYVAFRLCGVAASEVTSLGAQTHLWAPLARGWSSLARARGWDRLFSPVRAAGEVLGLARGLGLRGRGAVLCGIHDSNANFLTYAPLAPLVFLSTGTWIIAFDSGADFAALDPARDHVSNTTVSGAPVGCARFMGGAEYAAIAGAGNRAVPAPADLAALVARGTMALPSFTDSGGPVPGRGGQGKIVGSAPETDAASAALAALFCAQMTALALNGLGRTARVVVDGPFAGNPGFLAALAALLPGRDVLRSELSGGSARGAAALALPGVAAAPETTPVAPLEGGDLAGYHARWLRLVEG